MCILSKQAMSSTRLLLAVSLCLSAALRAEGGANVSVTFGPSGLERADWRGIEIATAPPATKLKMHGIRFGYHNHSYEFFRPERHGPTLYDILIDETDRDLLLELDLYWAECAGLNCTRLLDRCHGRLPVIHLKDKETMQGEYGVSMPPIGEGNMDWASIIPAYKRAGVERYAVEQDECYRDPFDCLKSSFDYISSYGL